MSKKQQKFEYGKFYTIGSYPGGEAIFFDPDDYGDIPFIGYESTFKPGYIEVDGFDLLLKPPFWSPLPDYRHLRN